MNYYNTTIFTYDEFVKENNTNKISKNEKLIFDNINKYLELNEIFDTNINKLDYTLEEYKHPVYDNEINKTYFFNSKNGNKYRTDFVILKEDNSNLKDSRLFNKKFISISFSLAESTEINYDEPTNLNELYDVMGRIRYLIGINEHKINEGYVFMFGKPTDDKIKMYKYFIKICFPNYRLIIDNTTGFKTSNIGYYLIK